MSRVRSLDTDFAAAAPLQFVQFAFPQTVFCLLSLMVVCWRFERFTTFIFQAIQFKCAVDNNDEQAQLPGLGAK